MADQNDAVRRKAEDKPNWSMKATPILVRVGSQEAVEDFYIHESLLIAHSNFFRAALGKPWKERKERQVTLPEETAKGFAHFAHFVYYGHLYVSNAPGSEYAEYECLASVWTMADRLGSITLEDAVTDGMCSIIKTRRKCPLGIIKDIYPASSEDAGLRLLLVDCLARVLPAELLKLERGAESAAIWFDVLRGIQNCGATTTSTWRESITERCLADDRIRGTYLDRP